VLRVLREGGLKKVEAVRFEDISEVRATLSVD